MLLVKVPKYITFAQFFNLTIFKEFSWARGSAVSTNTASTTVPKHPQKW